MSITAMVSQQGHESENRRQLVLIGRSGLEPSYNGATTLKSVDRTCGGSGPYPRSTHLKGALV